MSLRGRGMPFSGSFPFSAYRDRVWLARSVLGLVAVAALVVATLVAPVQPGVATAQTATAPGAPDAKPTNPPNIYEPSTTVNRTPSGGASPGPWAPGTALGELPDPPLLSPTVGPSVAPTSVAKPGLGAQRWYPLERRQLGDRMELLINLANGNVIVRYRDISYKSVGINQGVDHVYNNLSPKSGAFGRAWNMSTGRDVGLDLSDASKVVLHGPTGYEQTYERNGDGSYRTPPGADAVLTRNGDGTYELKFNESEDVWNFDGNGFFTSQQDKNDNRISYQYNPDGTLASVTDTQGRGCPGARGT